MAALAISAGSLAMLLLFVMGTAFLIVPNKAKELFGTYTTQSAHPVALRVLGLMFMMSALFFEGVIISSFLK